MRYEIDSQAYPEAKYHFVLELSRIFNNFSHIFIRKQSKIDISLGRRDGWLCTHLYVEISQQAQYVDTGLN